MKHPNDVLFSSDLWEAALQSFARATHLTVKLFDADLRLVFGPIHPTPLFQVLDERGYDPGIIAECARRCLIQTDKRPAVMISEVYGLAVIGTSLVLQGKVVGAAIAAYAFVDFSQASEIHRLARKSGIQFERLWRVAREQKPVPQRQLAVHGELLQVLGDALLRENYRTRQQEQNADNLERLVDERASTVRELSLNLLRAQDELSRRIARELHDGVGQYLAHATIGLQSFIQKPEITEKGMEALSHIAENLDKCLTETRTISHLLHPPLLDELGFISAARAYVEGFSKRSGIPANLNIAPDLKRLPSDLELVLFRTLQEGLTNVLRHAHSESVDISVELGANQVALAVRDYGKGIPQAVLTSFEARKRGGGIGLNSMRERTKQFGGRLEIQSNGKGTLVRVVLPLPGVDALRTEAVTAGAGADRRSAIPGSD